jgi:hypothetical protein
MHNRVTLQEILKFTLKQLLQVLVLTPSAGAYAATPPNQPQRYILTDYFNNYNFSKLK